MTTATQPARVEVLTAEVRVLQVGSRQVTLSVYRQLDYVPINRLELFGRVHSAALEKTIELIGRDIVTGALVRSQISDEPKETWEQLKSSTVRNPDSSFAREYSATMYDDFGAYQAAFDHIRSLPLIALAGLK